MVGLQRKGTPAKIMMNTVISAATGGLVSAFLKLRWMGSHSEYNQYDATAVCNGILTGLVAVTGVCDACEPWGGCAIGFVAGLLYVGGCIILRKLQIDDPVEASVVHGIGGMWGTIATGFFHNEKGLFGINSPERWEFFGWQILGLIVIYAWVAVLSFAFFFGMKKLNFIRVKPLQELIGLDYAEMGALDDARVEDFKRIMGVKAGESKQVPLAGEGPPIEER